MRLDELLPLLQRFPQSAHLEMCGDRGIEDLRVVLVDRSILPEGHPGDFRVDAPDRDLPWLDPKPNGSDDHE
jgi:hypothetical protein